MKLEFIVVHHDEDWRAGKRFFDMLAMQRDVNFKDILVTIIQSGQRQLAWDNIICRYPYSIRAIKSSGDNLADARNTGIGCAEGDWIMFCDFDDSFADLYALRSILPHIPNDTHDILWMKYYSEQPRRDGKPPFIGIVKETLRQIHGKLFRTEFIRENKLSFPVRNSPVLDSEMADAFLSIAVTYTTNNRFGHIATEFIPYIHSYRPGSMTDKNAFINPWASVFIRDITIISALSVKPTDNPRYARDSLNAIARFYCDSYFSLNRIMTDEEALLRNDFIRLHEKLGKFFYSIRPDDIEVAMQSAESEAVNITQEQYNRFGREFTFADMSVSIYNWLSKIEQTMDNPPEHPVAEKKQPAPSDIIPRKPAVNRDRVAVYAGTRNVYKDMLTSAKSLVAHTKVDRIYFLIEDDDFPEPLPPYVHHINVSYYKNVFKNSLNASNVWTYMALARAAYASILPYESRVLSLDVDVIVQEDISFLFDFEMNGCYIAGVNEQNRADRDKKDYINFGVVVMDLDAIREDGIDNKVTDLLQHTKLGFPEQDAFNRVCDGRIWCLPTEYNVCRYTHVTGESDREYISHYAGINYYRGFETVRRYADMSWADAERERERKERNDAE